MRRVCEQHWAVNTLATYYVAGLRIALVQILLCISPNFLVWTEHDSPGSGWLSLAGLWRSKARVVEVLLYIDF